MIDYDTAKYPISQAAKASGFELGTLRSYYQRGHFRLLHGKDQAAAAKGLPHYLSLRSVLALAVSQRLWRMGLDPWLAFKAGLIFTNGGDHNYAGPARAPGELYPLEVGFTVLIWQENDAVKIVPLPKNGGLDFATLFWNPTTRERTQSLIVLLNDVERDVFCALGIDGHESPPAAPAAPRRTVPRREKVEA